MSPKPLDIEEIETPRLPPSPSEVYAMQRANARLRAIILAAGLDPDKPVEEQREELMQLKGGIQFHADLAQVEYRRRVKAEADRDLWKQRYERLREMAAEDVDRVGKAVREQGEAVINIWKQKHASLRTFAAVAAAIIDQGDPRDSSEYCGASSEATREIDAHLALYDVLRKQHTLPEATYCHDYRTIRVDGEILHGDGQHLVPGSMEPVPCQECNPRKGEEHPDV